MKVRIEVRAERVDRLHAALAQRLDQLLVNELDAAPDRTGRLGAGVGLERPVHVVDEREQFLEQIRGGRFRQLDPLALDPLAVVVELGGLAQQPIVVVVALLPQLGGIAVLGAFRGGRRRPFG